MDFSSVVRRTSKKPTKSELYSTFVVHSDEEEEEDDVQTQKKLQNPRKPDAGDIYATMLCKDDDDPNDDESLPPLLKRLPKDFGVAVDSDDDGESISGTMIVKTRRGRGESRYRSDEEDDDDEDEDGGGFGTFVVRSEERDSESVSGTFVRRTSGGSGGTSTMSRAVASMQAVGEGFGKGRKGSGTQTNREYDEGGHSRQQTSKMSSGSIADSVTREDPSTKYELLHELGTLQTLKHICCFV